MNLAPDDTCGPSWVTDRQSQDRSERGRVFCPFPRKRSQAANAGLAVPYVVGGEGLPISRAAISAFW